MSRYISLTKGFKVLVDDSDYQNLMKYKWYVWESKRGHRYAARRNPLGGTLFMHRFILKAKEGYMVDHKNGNGLDNTRLNIREVTREVNTQNSKKSSSKKYSSKWKGVKKASVNSWCAHINIMGRYYNIGSTSCQDTAAMMYNEIAREWYGDFCKLNESTCSAELSGNEPI